MPRDAAETRPAPSLKGAVYRQARLWHGWLSALAFLALIFFAATGLLLNNPDWFETKPAATVRSTTLPPAELSRALAAPDPDRSLAEAVARRLDLRGVYQKPRPNDRLGDRSGKLRLRGVTGGAEITIDRATGAAKVKVERVNALTVLTNLHKGKNAGPAWHLVIDAFAVTVLLLSLLGYVLFFTLRFRLRTGLILTGVTLAGAVGLFALTVP